MRQATKRHKMAATFAPGARFYFATTTLLAAATTALLKAPSMVTAKL
jgi:hypothetical protein